MKSLEETIKNAIAKELNDVADKLIEKKLDDIKLQLKEVAYIEIGKIVSSLVYREDNDPVSMGTNITLIFRKQENK